MATATLLVLTSKEKDGTVPIYLQLNHKDKIRRISLSIRVPVDRWNNDKRRVRRSHPQRGRINRHLARVEAVAQEQIMRLRTEGIEPTVDRMKARITDTLDGNTESHSFIDYARSVNERYARREQYATHNRHRQWIGKLEAFAKRKGWTGISFDDLTVDLLEDFRTYLFEVDELGANTVAKHLKGMRTFLYKAMKEGRHAESNNPFFHITITETRAKKEKLTPEEFERIQSADVEGDLALARDTFLFSVYTQGIRVADQMLLRRRNIEDGRVEYTMRKNGKHKSIRLVGPAQEIVERYLPEEGGPKDYVFPWLRRYGEKELSEREALSYTSTRNAVYNELLKELADQAGVEKTLTAHLARHTFSNMALENGWSLKKLQAALGHASLQTTEMYVKDLKDEGLDEDMEGLFGE